MEQEAEEERVGVTADLLGLPETCLTQIISLTSPRDALRLLAVSPNPCLRSSAESDFVWQTFLPSDYKTIISRSFPNLPSFSSMKNLYLHLCTSPILLDRGNMSFVMDKLSGKKSYMIGARELSIAWGNAPHYWSWISLSDSRFLEAAQLLSVCWLDIRGKIESRGLSPNTNYGAYFVYKVGENCHGLQYPPVKVSVGFIEEGGEGEADAEASDAYLQVRASRHSPEQRGGQRPLKRPDGWSEIEMGEFFIDGGNDGLLEMRLREVKVLNWKSGIVVQGIEVRPKE